MLILEYLKMSLKEIIKSVSKLCSINSNFDFLCTEICLKTTYSSIVEQNQNYCRTNYCRTSQCPPFRIPENVLERDNFDPEYFFFAPINGWDPSRRDPKIRPLQNTLPLWRINEYFFQTTVLIINNNVYFKSLSYKHVLFQLEMSDDLLCLKH